MNNQKHTKHSKLARPHFGNFARREWAFVGAPCSDIRALCTAVASQLSDIELAYIDADHGAIDAPNEAQNRPFSLEYLDFFSFQQRSEAIGDNPYARQKAFQAIDLAFINGNHFEAEKQIVLLHPKKEASLKKRLEQLKQVDVVVHLAPDVPIFDFLIEKITEQTLILNYEEATAGLVYFFKENLKKTAPPLYGLVLAGGKSQRMGFDKTQIDYHGKAQALFMAEMLACFCKKTYISTKENTGHAWETQFPALPDSFTDLGPYGGILSAFRQHPEAAWLVVASDLPFLNASTLDFLIKNRKISATATAFRSPTLEKEGIRFPEPLITIWEPKSYLLLLEMLAMGISCPRKVLINSNTHLLEVSDSQALMNVNLPEEFVAAKAAIEEK